MIISMTRGAGYALKGFGIINQKGIRPFVLIPLLINITLFSLGIWLLSEQFDSWMTQLTDWLPNWLDWLEWLLWPLFVISIAAVFFYTFSIIANLVSAPFNALLAEQVEAKLSGKKLKGSELPLMKVVIGAFKAEFRKLMYTIKWAIPLIILSFIPVINIIAPVLWLIFSAWLLALEYSDYPMGNHDMFFPDELALLSKNRGLALGFGGVVMMLTYLPLLNFLAMPVSVCGATAMWVDKLKVQAGK